LFQHKTGAIVPKAGVAARRGLLSKISCTRFSKVLVQDILKDHWNGYSGLSSGSVIELTYLVPGLFKSWYKIVRHRCGIGVGAIWLGLNGGVVVLTVVDCGECSCLRVRMLIDYYNKPSDCPLVIWSSWRLVWPRKWRV
jgi:hypothetical protein